MGNNIRDRFKNFRRRGSQPEQLQQVQTDLLAESTLDSAYIILIISSCAIATLGLLSNSTAVIIGAMIIAPPPEVRLSVRAREPVTPRQVELLEEFIKREMGQTFTLIFEVGQVEEIRSSEPTP
ncbi:hypothetical protein LC608_00530 [Nostoc sp. XA010]|uniref:hypothetical protein n=1 Tax=Nostoc sp. XA010 TaxID=2780407 RepID=UPI001E4F483B|nr:hypothetical protein [Nostoc sp. XA010]MCC5655500.1 hypothetical protein [Nostoc sp. XA010]